MEDGSVYQLLAFVAFGYAALGLLRGYIPTRSFLYDGGIDRSEHPFAYWGYLAMIVGIGTVWLRFAPA